MINWAKQKANCLKRENMRDQLQSHLVKVLHLIV